MTPDRKCGIIIMSKGTRARDRKKEVMNMKDTNIGMTVKEFLAENEENLTYWVDETEEEEGYAETYWGTEYAIRNGKIAKC